MTTTKTNKTKHTKVKVELKLCAILLRDWRKSVTHAPELSALRAGEMCEKVETEQILYNYQHRTLTFFK